MTKTREVEATASFGDTDAVGIVTVALPEIDWYDFNTLEYHIQTEEQLVEMTHVLTYGVVNELEGKTVYLDNDIELKNEWTVMPGFSGTFDGQGNTISGLSISDAGENGVGLFGSLGSTGTVKNLAIEDAGITTDRSVERWLWQSCQLRKQGGSIRNELCGRCFRLSKRFYPRA